MPTVIDLSAAPAKLEMLRERAPHSIAVRAGTIAIVPQGAWHRFGSAEGVTLMTAKPRPTDHVRLDVDDPRAAKP